MCRLIFFFFQFEIVLFVSFNILDSDHTMYRRFQDKFLTFKNIWKDVVVKNNLELTSMKVSFWMALQKEASLEVKLKRYFSAFLVSNNFVKIYKFLPQENLAENVQEKSWWKMTTPYLLCQNDFSIFPINFIDFTRHFSIFGTKKKSNIYKFGIRCTSGITSLFYLFIYF